MVAAALLLLLFFFFLLVLCSILLLCSSDPPQHAADLEKLEAGHGDRDGRSHSEAVRLRGMRLMHITSTGSDQLQVRSS